MRCAPSSTTTAAAAWLANGPRAPRWRSCIGSPRYVAAFHEKTSGHLHPLKYALGLAQAAKAAGVRIFEGSAVMGLRRGASLVAVHAQRAR